MDWAVRRFDGLHGERGYRAKSTPLQPTGAETRPVKRYLLLGLCLALSLTACGFRGGPDADPALLPSYRTELRDTTTATLPVLAEALDSTVKHGQFTYTRSGGDGLSPDPRHLRLLR